MTPRANCERCQLPLYGLHVDNFCARCLKAMSESKTQRDREVALEDKLKAAEAELKTALEAIDISIGAAKLLYGAEHERADALAALVREVSGSSNPIEQIWAPEGWHDRAMELLND